MRFLKRRRLFFDSKEPIEDPIQGVANLFDAGVVFIVSMMIALFMAYNMLELLNPESELTIVKKDKDGKIEIITKKGRKIEAKRVTDRRLSGRGVKLGTAYRLEDGRVIYVPE